ncbi:MAG: hypothetical protein ACI8RZ_000773 [Myxococcota bacterium]|jgi:hypothetical protein
MDIKEQWRQVEAAAAGEGAEVVVGTCPDCGGRAAWRGVVGACWEAKCQWSGCEGGASVVLRDAGVHAEPAWGALGHPATSVRLNQAGAG